MSKFKAPERQLILLRGMPGAGKSTFAQFLASKAGGRGEDFKHVEGDQWRGFGAEREYSSEFNENAHIYAIGYTAHLLRFTSYNIVVSNVFPTLKHLEPYFKLAQELNRREKVPFNIKVTVMHVQGPIGRSVHDGVGKGDDGSTNRVDYQHYADVWEDYKGEFSAV